MGFKSISEVVGAEVQGKTRTYNWNKIAPANITTVWFDMAVQSGNPRAKLWFDASPLVAQQVRQSTDGGIFHGANVSPSEKYLRNITFLGTAFVMSLVPITFLDYLLYYPTIDESTTDPQVMNNTLTLPRYTDGKGVQMMAVSLATRVGGKTFSVSYTNSEGVSGRTSQTMTQVLVSGLGTILTANAGASISAQPFIGLQHGDSGVRSVESVTMNGTDIGFFAIILVKPLATINFSTQGVSPSFTCPTEKDYLMHSCEMERIYDDAYINFIAVSNNNQSGGNFQGSLKCIWT